MQLLSAFDIAKRRRARGALAVGASLVLVSVSGMALASDPPTPYVAPTKTGINKDAMTMQECRDRLAAPKRDRPPSDDPAINKDAVCANMLGADKTTHRPPARHVKAASAA